MAAADGLDYSHTPRLAGSHQLVLEIERAHDGPVRSAYVRERLKTEHPCFASLLAARGAHVRGLMNVESRVGGYTVRLEEMTGAPGDLIIMHPAFCMVARTTRLTAPG